MRKFFVWRCAPKAPATKSSRGKAHDGRYRTLGFQALEPRDMKSADVAAALSAGSTTTLADTTSAAEFASAADATAGETVAEIPPTNAAGYTKAIWDPPAV